MRRDIRNESLSLYLPIQRRVPELVLVINVIIRLLDLENMGLKIPQLTSYHKYYASYGTTEILAVLHRCALIFFVTYQTNKYTVKTK